MKKLIHSSLIAILITGCINSSTNFTNRSITNMATHELLGERAQVTSSPSSNDSTVNAEKRVETETKANVAQNLNDNSSNNQKTSQPTTEKPIEKTNETDKK